MATCWVLKRTLRTEPLYEEQTGELIDEGGVLIGKRGEEVDIVTFNRHDGTVLISIGEDLFSIDARDLMKRRCK